jgi:sec-independent protein translocase protein TatA
MGELSIYHWLVVLAILLLLFGGRKIPELMRGLGGGIRSFREGLHNLNGAGELPHSDSKAEKRRDQATQIDVR